VHTEPVSNAQPGAASDGPLIPPQNRQPRRDFAGFVTDMRIGRLHGQKTVDEFFFGKEALFSKIIVSLHFQTMTMNCIDINARMLFLNIKKRDVYCLF
jgi:hypothetical protein